MSTTKECGCRPDALTVGKARWLCAGCGLAQAAKGARQRCAQCNRSKGPNPKGFGCCEQDWPQGTAACGVCGSAFDPIMDLGRLPHPDVLYLTEDTLRGSFVARDGFRHCVGCLSLAE
jgi:hypothetical protein